MADQDIAEVRHDEVLEQELILELTQKLYRSISLVKRARFDAASRLRAIHANSLLTLSILSLLSILFALYTAAFNTSIPHAEIGGIFIFTTFTSIFTIIIGLLESQKNYSERAAFLQQCASDLNSLRYQIAIERYDITKKKYLLFINRNDEILARCPYNHEHIDYLTAKNSMNKSWGYFLIVKFLLVLNKHSRFLVYIAPVIMVYLLTIGFKFPSVPEVDLKHWATTISQKKQVTTTTTPLSVKQLKNTKASSD